MVLGGRPPGRVGRRRNFSKTKPRSILDRGFVVFRIELCVIGRLGVERRWDIVRIELTDVQAFIGIFHWFANVAAFLALVWTKCPHETIRSHPDDRPGVVQHLGLVRRRGRRDPHQVDHRVDSSAERVEIQNARVMQAVLVDLVVVLTVVVLTVVVLTAVDQMAVVLTVVDQTVVLVSLVGFLVVLMTVVDLMAVLVSLVGLLVVLMTAVDLIAEALMAEALIVVVQLVDPVQGGAPKGDPTRIAMANVEGLSHRASVRPAVHLIVMEHVLGEALLASRLNIARKPIVVVLQFEQRAVGQPAVGEQQALRSHVRHLLLKHGSMRALFHQMVTSEGRHLVPFTEVEGSLHKKLSPTEEE